MFCNVHFPEGKTHEDEATMHRILEMHIVWLVHRRRSISIIIIRTASQNTQFSDDRYDI